MPITILFKNLNIIVFANLIYQLLKLFYDYHITDKVIFLVSDSQHFPVF